jgi:hypothetical protein
LVGDPDRGHVGRSGSRVVQSRRDDRARHLPDLARVVFDPPGVRIVLSELGVGPSSDLGPRIYDQHLDAGRSRVDRQHQFGHRARSPFRFARSLGLSVIDGGRANPSAGGQS